MLTVPRLYSQRAVYHVENWIIRLTVLFVIISPSIRLDLPGVGGTTSQILIDFYNYNSGLTWSQLNVIYQIFDIIIELPLSRLISSQVMLSLGRGVTRPSQQFQIKLNKLKCDRRNQRGMLENVLPRISLTGLSISTEPELSNSATFYRFHWRFIKLVASRTPISRLGRMSLTINCECVPYFMFSQ